MIFNLAEKKVACPLCGINIDLVTTDYPMKKAALIDCPWCGRRLRIWKKLKLRPKKDRGIYFIVKPALKRTGGGRDRSYSNG